MYFSRRSNPDSFCLCALWSWCVCSLCNQAEDVRGPGSGWLPNIAGICHFDTSAVRIGQAAACWPCCSYTLVHGELIAGTLTLSSPPPNAHALINIILILFLQFEIQYLRFKKIDYVRVWSPWKLKTFGKPMKKYIYHIYSFRLWPLLSPDLSRVR